MRVVMEEAHMSDIIEQLERQHADARARLEACGKTMQDLSDFLRFHKKQGSNPPGWSDYQAAVGLEFAHVEALLAEQYGAKFSPASRSRLALDLARARELRVRWETYHKGEELARKLTPDILRGRKVRKAGAEAHGTKESRHQEAMEFHEIWKSLNPNLSDAAKYKLFVNRFNKKYPDRKPPSPGTIKNRFKEFSSELGIAPEK
jgi:hypothetical protein